MIRAYNMCHSFKKNTKCCEQNAFKPLCHNSPKSIVFNQLWARVAIKQHLNPSTKKTYRAHLNHLGNTNSFYNKINNWSAMSLSPINYIVVLILVETSFVVVFFIFIY